MTETIRVLHVEDRPEFADVASELLEGADERIRVTTATDTSEGLELIDSGSFDCVVCDYDMPGKDGIELLEAVRARRPDLPFILFTGKGSEEVASAAISAGVTDYLQKGTGTEQYELLANRIDNAVSQYRAEQRANAADRRLQELTETTNDVLWMFSADWSELLFINSAYETMWGRSIEALEDDPRDFLAAVHPEDRDRVEDGMERLSNGNSVDVEIRVRSDRERWIWIQGEPIVEDGTVARVAGFGSDITERKERERRLETQAAAMDASIDGMAILDEDGNYAFVNRAHAEVYGYDDPEWFIGRSWKTCYSEDELDRMESEVVPTLYEEGSWRGEGVGTRKDGTTFPQELSLTALESGHLICVVRDITERREREADLRETNRILQGILDTTPAAIFVKDREGRYQLMNDEAREAILPSGTDVLGKTDYDLFPENVADRFLADDRQVVESGEPIELEEEVPTAAGPRTFLTLKSPMTDPDGEVTGICAVSTDITDRVEYAREVERQNERLEEFASVVSHDLQNPLNVARGRLDLARTDCDSPHLENVATAHERMATLIDDLLTWAKHGDTVRETESVDLPAAVERCWSTVERAEATLVCETDRTVEADPSRCKQVLENLFSNAIEHAMRADTTAQAAGGGDATASGECDGPTDGDHVTITVGDCPDGFFVADDGAGIPADERDRVFESGYSTVDDGTGFGLSIVRQVVEAHGWSIEVTESAEGGARFEITGVDFQE